MRPKFHVSTFCLDGGSTTSSSCACTLIIQHLASTVLASDVLARLRKPAVSSLAMADADNLPTVTSEVDSAAAVLPPDRVSAGAHVASMAVYKEMYARSIANPRQFWADAARSNLTWFRDFTEVCVLPIAKQWLHTVCNDIPGRACLTSSSTSVAFALHSCARRTRDGWHVDTSAAHVLHLRPMRVYPNS